METSLLATKLFIPPARPGIVARPRLLERLRSAIDCRLILVSAPAGSGKTTLVSDWTRQSNKQCRCAWVSLDDGDNDPVRFWDYFIAAVRTIQPSAGENALTLLHSPQPYPTEAMLTALINDLTSSTADDFAVVLDDYHLIKAEPIQAGTAFLLEHLPARMHLVIATRTDPPLPLPRFRGRGMILEIRADDLRFTLDEATALLRELIGRTLSAEEVNALNEHTEGWAVGLKMAALSMKGRQNSVEFITGFTGSQRYVMDYLVDEVLKNQSDDVRDFLLRTSVLERLTAPLCDSLTEHRGAQQMLERLEQSNLFLIPLDDSRQWYRYHHLFADLLRHQLEASYGPEEIYLLHQRASQWYEEHSLPDEAIHHALAACDWDRAMRLISAHSEARLNQGEWNTLLAWLQAIPEEVLRTKSRLYSLYGNVLTTGGKAEAAEAVLSYLARTAQEDASLMGEVALFQALLARSRGNLTQHAELTGKALALLPSDKLAFRARASFLLAYVELGWTHLETAWSLLTDAYEMGRQAGEYWTAAGAAAFMGLVLSLRGKLHEALETIRMAVELGGQSSAAAVPLGCFARILYERNDLVNAIAKCQLAIRFSELGGSADSRVTTYPYLVQSSLAQGDIAGAAAETEKWDQSARHPSLSAFGRSVYTAARTITSIRQDDLTAASEWGDNLPKYGDNIADAWFIADAWIPYVPARLLIAQGFKKEAAEQLRALYERAVRAEAQGLVIQARVYQALAEETPDKALAFLSEALKLGQPEGFIRTFVDEGKLLKPLLQKALAQRVTPEYTAKLLNIIEAEERQRQSGSGKTTPLPQPSGVLSERESEILKLVAGGLSNRQISERLIISLGTVKTHVHNIFEKLGVKTRTQAIAQARELKLL